MGNLNQTVPVLAVNALISVPELATLLQNKADCVVFDVRHDLMDYTAGRKAYETSHIAGAYFLDNETDLCCEKTGFNGRHPLPDPQDFLQLLSRYGITPDTLVVAYDSSGATFASHLWWMLRWVGHSKVQVLDGGWNAWQQAKLPTNSGVQTLPAAAKLLPLVLQQDAVVSLAEVEQNVFHPRFTLMDARAAERFAGKVEPIDPIAGRIPNSINRPHLDNIDPQGFFKPLTQLQQEFSDVLGNISAADIVHTCGSGVTACVNLMVMEMLGLTGSRLYGGSWSEWCSESTRPMVKNAELLPFKGH